MEVTNSVQWFPIIESTSGSAPYNPIQWGHPVQTTNSSASQAVNLFEPSNPIQWVPHIEATNDSTSLRNRVNSSRAGCPRDKVFTDVCGIVQSSKLPLGQAPSFLGSKGTRRFHCCLCGKTFSRRHTVKPHFVACVNRNGNPEGKSWNDHPSVAGYKPRRVMSEYQLNRQSFMQAQISWNSPSQGVVLPVANQAPPVGPGSGEYPPIDPALEVEQAVGLAGNVFREVREEWPLYHQPQF